METNRPDPELQSDEERIDRAAAEADAAYDRLREDRSPAMASDDCEKAWRESYPITYKEQRSRAWQELVYDADSLERAFNDGWRAANKRAAKIVQDLDGCDWEDIARAIHGEGSSDGE